MSEQPGRRDEDRLLETLAQQARRREAAQKDRGTILGQTMFLGVLGLVFVLPVVLGAYLGHWLDGHEEGYSVRWTLGLLLAGVALGATNVYLMIRR